MTNKQFKRLNRISYALNNYPSKWNTRPSKRSVKGNGRGVGQVLKGSQVREQVPLNKIFLTRK